MIWSIIYLVAVLTANYTAVWFIPLPAFGIISVGTILFGATFTARDYVHSLGRDRVYMMIAVAALASAALSVAGSVDWRNPGGQPAFQSNRLRRGVFVVSFGGNRVW